LRSRHIVDFEEKRRKRGEVGRYLERKIKENLKKR